MSVKERNKDKEVSYLYSHLFILVVTNSKSSGSRVKPRPERSQKAKKSLSVQSCGVPVVVCRQSTGLPLPRSESVIPGNILLPIPPNTSNPPQNLEVNRHSTGQRPQHWRSSMILSSTHFSTPGDKSVVKAEQAGRRTSLTHQRT